MNFCSQCGAKVELRVPDGDNRERFVCPNCDTIHYQNPLVVAGCVAEWEGKLLLCRRAIEPRHGFWTVPAGFMENGETVAQGAARETWEEALAKVTTTTPLAIVDVVHARQVHIFYRGRMDTGEFGAGTESLETRLVEEDEIPWDEIAFPSVKYAMRRYLEDRAAGVENMHETEIKWRRPD